MIDLSDLVPEKPRFLYKYWTAERAAQILRDQYLYLAPINHLFEFALLALLSEDDSTPATTTPRTWQRPDCRRSASRR